MCVLNFASATNPGGGVVKGSSAQEEAICRCSTLYPNLKAERAWEKFYAPHRRARDPLHNDDCIYTPGVMVFKADTDYDNRRKIVLMHYPVFCYNGQFRRGADGTPLTYMLHGHIHKTEDQVLVDKFCAETRAMMRKSAHQETAQPVPCQMINCFCMYSDYTPLTLEEWIECDQRRRDKADCG